jgi:hypothetical protein
MRKPDKRERGYYWIKFNWPMFKRPDKRWEPASYDNGTWVLIGSRELIPDGHPLILAVGERIEEPRM